MDFERDVNMSNLIFAFMQAVDADIYMMTHTTAPLITAESIHRGLARMEEGHDSAMSVLELRQFAWYDQRPLNYDIDYIIRTQDLQPILVETSGFYIFKKEVIRRGNRIGHNPAFVSLDQREAMDIDTLDDFEMVEYFLRKSQCDH